MSVSLKTKHIIMLAKLVNKLKMDDVIDLDKFKENPSNESKKMIFSLLRNIPDAETEFMELIGSIAGITPEQAAETEIEQLLDEISEVVTKIINFYLRRKGSATST